MGITKEQLEEILGPDSVIGEDTAIKLKILIEQAVAEKLDAQIQEKLEAEQSKYAALEEKISQYEEYVLAEQEELTESFVAEKEQLMEQANAYSDYVVAEMTEKVDAYSDYVVENFMTENQSALVETAEYNKMKSLFEKVKGAFEEANFALQENTQTPTDPDQALVEELETVKESFNDIFNQYQQVVKENEEMHFAIVFEHLTKDLASTQVEKIKEIIENITFDGVHEFKRAVELMIEQFKGAALSEETKSDLADQLLESTADVPAKPKSADMGKYLKFI